MVLLIISIALVIGLSIFWYMYESEKLRRVNMYIDTDKQQKAKLKLRHITVLLPLLLCLLNFFIFIPANNVGILYSPFSGVRTETLSEGFHSKGFLDKVYKISTEVQSKKIENLYGQTRDSQYLQMVIDVKYTVNSSNAYKIFKQFKDLKNVDENLITPMVQRSIEAITTQFNVIEVLGERRNDMYQMIEKDLQTRMASAGIDFYQISFVDTDAGEAIEKAIQNEAVAKKAIETAEQERKKVEIDSQKRIIEAEANKRQALVDAETKLIEAEAQRKANELLSQSLSENILKKMEMEARMKHGWVTVTGVNSIIKE